MSDKDDLTLVERVRALRLLAGRHGFDLARLGPRRGGDLRMMGVEVTASRALAPREMVVLPGLVLVGDDLIDEACRQVGIDWRF